jgi:hypothetical protein
MEGRHGGSQPGGRRLLGMTANTVRQAKSRILLRLKEELGELIA